MQAAVARPTLRTVPLWAWLLLAVLAVFVYAVGYDQGLFERAVHGLDSQTLHEFFHDGRHLLGFACH